MIADSRSPGSFHCTERCRRARRSQVFHAALRTTGLLLGELDGAHLFDGPHADAYRPMTHEPSCGRGARQPEVDRV